MKNYMDCSDWQQCTECGKCLIKCPVLHLDRDSARIEIQSLLNGLPAPKVLDACTLCFNCNRYCPVGLRPYELILQRAMENRRGRVSNVIPYMLNSMPGPTFFQDLYDRLDETETAILAKWSLMPPPSKDILWVGCIGRLSCLDIDRSNVLKPLPKYGPSDLCCGELHYRFGSWKAYADMTAKTLARLEKLQIERMVCWCGSCYNFFSNMLPTIYGKNLPFKLISFYEWVLERYEQGKLTLKQPLNLKAAVNESCYVSELNPEFPKALRRLYKAIGMETVELEHHGDVNLSCGMASLARNLNPLDSFLPSNRKKFKETKAAGVKTIATHCPGCYLSLMPTGKFFRVKTMYMPDAILRAFGDEIERPLSSRMGMILKTFGRRLPYLMQSTDDILPRIPIKKKVADE